MKVPRSGPIDIHDRLVTRLSRKVADFVITRKGSFSTSHFERFAESTIKQTSTTSSIKDSKIRESVIACVCILFGRVG
jgi:hypothetical protein